MRSHSIALSLPHLVRSAALALLACAAVSLPVARAADLTVHRVAPPAGATARGRSVATPAGGRPLTAEQARILALKVARQREFLPIQRLLFAPDKAIDRSSYGNRRVGWRPPAGPRRDALHPDRLLGATATDDTFRLAILRVDFLADRGGSKSSGDGRFNLDPSDTLNNPVDPPPHNRDFYESHARALERFYDAQTYGRFHLKVDVWPSERDSAYHATDMADLGPWSFGQGVYRAAVDMMRKMFFAADSQSTRKGERIPWDTYDRFCIIHAGGDLQSDIKQDSKEDIPSFTIFVSDTDDVIFPDSTTRPIDRCSFVPETANQDGYYGAINGVLAHENGHNMFGFYDVYNVETGFPVCGYWTLMDSGNLLGATVQLKDGSEIFATGLLPPSIDPLQRGIWIDPTSQTTLHFDPPTFGDTLALANNERNDQMYKIPLSTDEYLLLENRYLAPADLVQLDADSLTHVVLGPKKPDRYEYDALEPGTGILIWHIDESVLPFTTSLRVNPDYAFNTNPARLGESIIQASGLADLGDPSSPFLLGSPLDPYQHSINPTLSDTTQPNLVPNQKTRPHLRIDFTDDAGPTMHFVVNRTWAPPGWPVIASFPPGGPVLLAIDATGERDLEVCWAGGRDATPDSAALFAVRKSGQGLIGPGLAFAHLDERPRETMAAVLTGDASLGLGPSLFAATTYWYGAADTLGGRVWLVDHSGAPVTGWPVRLPSPASTPPVITGAYPAIVVFVGCENGRVYALDAQGNVLATSDVSLAGGVRGRLAFWQGGGADGGNFLAAGGGGGEVAVFTYATNALVHASASWPQLVGPTQGFRPEFLWLRLGGAGANATADCAAGAPALVTHNADRLWAHCPLGPALAGWGRSFGDSIVAGLGAGDADGDGYPEVLYQTTTSQVGFVNRDGFASPGWPKPSTSEHLRTDSSPLSLDVDQDGRSEIIALNGSGMLTALDSRGRNPDGWPLATGSGATGTTLAADLDRDGFFEVVAPDRDSLLYAYSLPIRVQASGAPTWGMFGGDPGRTSSLPTALTPAPVAAIAGPLVRATFKAFPNPARRHPVSFGYTLSEPAEVEFRILDGSGHEVAAFEHHGDRAENVQIWDPGALPAGLYLARAKFSGAHGSQVATIPVGVLR